MKLPDRPKPILTRFLASAIFWAAVVWLLMLLSCVKSPIPEWTCQTTTKVNQNGVEVERYMDLVSFPGEWPVDSLTPYRSANTYIETFYRNGMEVQISKQTFCYK